MDALENIAREWLVSCGPFEYFFLKFDGVFIASLGNIVNEFDTHLVLLLESETSDDFRVNGHHYVVGDVKMEDVLEITLTETMKFGIDRVNSRRN